MNEAIMINCAQLHKKVSLDECKERHVKARTLGGPCLKCATGLGAARDQSKDAAPIYEWVERAAETPAIPPAIPEIKPEIKEKPVKIEKTNIYVQGKCPGCQQEKSILAKKGICQACLRVEKGARPPIDQDKKKPAGSAPTPDKSSAHVSTSEIKFLLPLLEQEHDLFKYVTILAKKEYRSLEGQIMSMLRRALEVDVTAQGM